MQAMDAGALGPLSLPGVLFICKPNGPVYGRLGYSITGLVTELGAFGGTLAPQVRVAKVPYLVVVYH